MFRAMAELLLEEIFERHCEGVGAEPFTTWGFAMMSLPVYTWYLITVGGYPLNTSRCLSECTPGDCGVAVAPQAMGDEQ